MPETFDIAIVGGGIAGASVAFSITGRRSVLLLEQEDAWGYHSTGRSAAEFTLRFHSPGAGRLTRASKDFFFDPPEGFSEVSLLRPRGNLLIANDEKADLLKSIFAEETGHTSAGVHALEMLSVDEAVGKVPFLDPDWVRAAFYDQDCWDIEVENLLQGYLRGARRSGAVLRQKSPLIAARRENGCWILTTPSEEVRARVVVDAAGGWADEVAKILAAEPLGLVPHRRTAIAVKVPGHDLSAMPEVNEIEETFYFKPDAGQLMVSPADETPVDPHDAWPEEIDIAYAAHYLTECTTLEVNHVAHSWAGLRTISPDRLPVIGASEKTEGFFWLAGLGGYGIQTSPAVGRLAAALLIGEPVPLELAREGIEAGTFSPNRFGG
jgi:D-arginine dehydrogenase